MSGFLEKALKNLKSNKLVALIQEQNIKHGRHDEYMENLVAEVQKLTSSFGRLKSGPVISKNLTTTLSKRLVQMERQCWANARYSGRKWVEIVGIQSPVHHN